MTGLAWKHERWEQLRQIAEDEFAKSLIAALVFDRMAAVAEVAGWFQTKWILDEDLRRMCMTLLKMSSDGVPVTPHNLSAQLLQIGKFTIFTPAQICVMVIDSFRAQYAHLRYHARTVHDHYRRRAAASEALSAADGLSQGEDLDAILEGLGALPGRLGPSPETRVMDNEDEFTVILDELEHGAKNFLDYGLPGVDKLLGGIHPGQLMVVGGRPSVGKSAMIGHLAAVVATVNEATALVFSMEMTAKEIYERWGAWVSQAPKTDRRAFMGGLSLVRELVKKGRLQVFTGSQSIAQIERQAKAYCKTMPVKLILVDYLQLVRSGKGREISREQQVADVSRRLKALALDLNVSVVAAAQLSRSGSDKPCLSSLRESGSIEQDSDTVLLLHIAPDAGRINDETCEVSVIVAKNRNGPTGHVTVAFRKPLFRFYAISAKNEELF